MGCKLGKILGKIALGGVGAKMPKGGSVSPILQPVERYLWMCNRRAFLALQSLVERYDCMAGRVCPPIPPPIKGHGRSPGLHACCDRMSELMTTTVESLATQEDLGVFQKLREELAITIAHPLGVNVPNATPDRRPRLEANRHYIVQAIVPVHPSRHPPRLDFLDLY
jgi:hypothetical protein